MFDLVLMIPVTILLIVFHKFHCETLTGDRYKLSGVGSMSIFGPCVVNSTPKYGMS